MIRTLFIGLDGATFTLLDVLTQPASDGEIVMPFLRSFIAGGTRAVLRSTPNPLTPPAWVSLMTGRWPGQHGVFDFLRVAEQNGEGFTTLYDARDIRVETIWAIASRQQQRVAALNFPITAPPRPVNGFLLPGFVPWKHLRRNSYPESLYERLKALDGFNPKELAWDFERENQSLDDLSETECEAWVGYHLPREEQWFRVARHLLASEQPDLMAVMFDGTDKIQHQAWRFLESALVSSDPSPWERRMRALCLRYFRQLDQYLEQLVALAGPKAQVFMASDHGFTHSTEVVRINRYLYEKGYLYWKSSDGSEQFTRREASAFFTHLDWKKTLAYCHTPSSNGITIRIARHPGEPGIAAADYPAFRARLIGDLETLCDPHSGERIIRAIRTREEAFPGPAMHQAPDLLLTLRDFGFVSIKNLEPVVLPRPYPVGTHHPEGIFLAAGPGIVAGQRGEPCDIVDVAATLLYSLGLEIPEDLEGRTPEAFFTAEQRVAHPIRQGAPTLPVADGTRQAVEASAAEKAKIIEQLHMLGYME
ncbi:MAG TPA: alkaline phosphatase family protein [Candidatus Competibacteraceae bacterium]|nr:alkaline phosphatase family protein [Candidatus Competibacteraceae bacterium]HRZ06285.1 alkaline phosphatase family protein [Candidatus Competibacteraceae bacterium]HSA45288.1 alkaline phosphatase family protein [Candidatus Competibacteraceae bacterium]